MILFLSVLSCSGSPDPTLPPPQVVQTDPFATSDTGGGDPPVTSSGDTGGTVGIDCEDPPAVPVSWDYIAEVPSNEDFDIDPAGLLYSIDQTIGDLFTTSYRGTPFRIGQYGSQPNLGALRVLPAGDLVLADTDAGTVSFVDPTTAVGTPWLTGLQAPRGMVVGPDGLLYIGDGGQILRADPEQPATPPEVLLEIPPPSEVTVVDIDGLIFSLDGTRLYFTHDAVGGLVGQLGIDATGAPGGSDTLTILPTAKGAGLEALDIDVCGNLYALASDGAMWRIRPDGFTEPYLLLNSPEGTRTTSLQFGTGIGYKADHLYVMNREAGGMFDVFVGLDGAP